MEIRKLEQMFEVLRSKPKKRLVAAYANDDHTICAVNAAVKEGLIEATLIGDEKVIAEVCKAENIDMSNFKVINEPVDTKAATMACDLINAGEADILMKGLLPTDKYMRAILNKERGLCPPNVTFGQFVPKAFDTVVTYFSRVCFCFRSGSGMMAQSEATSNLW